ncbi:MAG: Hint domain-containing protein [Hasllibacter sp.]
MPTQHGMRPLRAIIPGDRVLTFDDHDVVVTAVSRGFCSGFDGGALSRGPAGAVGNREETILTAEQRVLLESDEAEAATGDPFALVRARDLIGLPGVRRIASDAPIEMIALHFEDEQVVPVAGGLLMHCLAADEAGAMACLLRQRAAAPRYAEMPVPA